MPEKAAAYLHGLCQNHGFIDGNKRVAFMAADAFLLLNGLCLIWTQDQAYDLTLRTAMGELSREDLSATIASHLQPIEAWRSE